MSFLSNFKYLSTLLRSNTSVCFPLVDVLKLKLLHFHFFSHFIIISWSKLLKEYPNQAFRLHLVILLHFRCLIGYQELDLFINSKNLLSNLIQLDVIDANIVNNLILGKMVKIDKPTEHLISSFLSLLFKRDGRYKKIHHLSYPHGSLLNDFIASKFSNLSHSLLQNVFAKIIKVEKHVVLIKWDIKDIFWNIFITSHIH